MTTIFEDNNNNTVMTIPKITVIEMVIVAMIDRYKIEIVEHSYNEGTYRNVKMITVLKVCLVSQSYNVFLFQRQQPFIPSKEHTALDD